jgi:hypothetical protein
MLPLELSVIVFTPFLDPDMMPDPHGAGHHTNRVISDVVEVYGRHRRPARILVSTG